MARFNTVCPYCNKEIVGYDYEKREEIKLNSFKAIERARVISSDIQYVQANKNSPVMLFHQSCYKNANIKRSAMKFW